MTTVINNPSGGERVVERVEGDSSAGIIVGVIVALLLVVLFFVYGWPAIRNNQPNQPAPTPSTNINVQLPTPTPPNPNPAPTY